MCEEMWLKLQWKCQGGLHYLFSYWGTELDLAASEFLIKWMDMNRGEKKDLPWWEELVLGGGVSHSFWNFFRILILV